RALIADCASASEPISTNAKPRERPVSRSTTIVALSTLRPSAPNNRSNSSSIVLKERLPTKRRLPTAILLLDFSTSSPSGDGERTRDRARDCCYPRHTTLGAGPRPGERACAFPPLEVH